MARISRIQLADGVNGVSARMTSAPAGSPHSVAHATVLVGILLSMSLGVGIALLGDSPLFALGFLLVIPVAAGVLSVAWMRPASASPEHHPKIDRYLDDTSP